MPLPRTLLCGAVILWLALAGRAWSAEELSQADAERLFARDVYPLLRQKCFACHGEDAKDVRGQLDLRTRAGLLAGGESGEPSLIPGQPEVSPLLLAATRVDEAWSAMPPKENDRLTAEQLTSLRNWIAAGSPWPDDAALARLLQEADKWNAGNGVKVPTSGGLSPEWTNRRYDPANLWAYQPHRLQSEILTHKAGQHPVDQLIDRRLNEAGLSAAPRAERRTLIRRATFDLIGLPPTPQEIEAFLQDPNSDAEAFTKVIDRLLNSQHYGEKWGQHWLDVVRYADSSGFANDYERGTAWRYRDYVVRAFNRDKPYDEFIREQIAGDEIAESPARSETMDRAELLIATGFLRMGPWELTGMEVPKVARQRFLDDVTDIVGQVFLGHMLQCARCHDHKFDPVPTRDYYSIQAAFATTQLAERPAPFLPDENITGFEEKKYLEERQRFYKQIQHQLDQKSIAAARVWYKENNIDPTPFEQLVKKGQEDYDRIRQQLRKQGIAEEQIPPRHAGFTPQEFGLDRVSRKGQERLKWRFDRYEPLALSVYSGRTPELTNVSAPLRMPAARMTAGELEQTFILTGGDPFSPSQPVIPGVLSVVEHLLAGTQNTSAATDAPGEPATSPGIFGRRLALADWIASPQNPLTARVMVNRIWQGHFGQAIAGNPNNFGSTGKKPTHPDLLDWLAGEFISHGWSVKHMHRVIMTSNAYQRSSSHPDFEQLQKRDPHQELYAVFRPRRLTAEELRDATLLVTGELNPALGGIPIRPEMNPEAALQPRMVMGTFAEAWQPSPLPSQRHRRSIYALKIRGLRDPFLEVFNAPSPDLSCEARDVSTVTPQVFSLLNSENSFDRALALAQRVTTETDSPRLAIERIFLLTYGRSSTVQEIDSCLEHWNRMTARHKSLTFPPSQPPKQVVREAVEENTGEKFTFTEPLEVSEDLVPDLKAAAATPELRGLAEVCLVLLNSNEFAYVY